MKILKTHCLKGHPYDESNTIIQQSGLRKGRRICRMCARIRRNAYAKSHPDREYHYDRHRRFIRLAKRRCYFERFWAPRLNEWCEKARKIAVDRWSCYEPIFNRLNSRRAIPESETELAQNRVPNRKPRRLMVNLKKTFKIIENRDNPCDPMWFEVYQEPMTPLEALIQKEEGW